MADRKPLKRLSYGSKSSNKLNTENFEKHNSHLSTKPAGKELTDRIKLTKNAKFLADDYTGSHVPFDRKKSEHAVKKKSVVEGK